MAVTPEGSESKIVMQGVHVELTAALQASIREKFAPLLRHNEYIVRINLRLKEDQKLGQQRQFSATAQIEIGGPDLVASAEGRDAYVVLDELVEKLERLLRRRFRHRKEKRNHPHGVDIAANLPKVT